MFAELKDFEIGDKSGEVVQVDLDCITPAFLTLPALDPSVPVGFVSRDEPEMVLFAKRLAIAGVIEPADMTFGCDLSSVVGKCLSRKIRSATGEMKCLLIKTHFSTPSALRYSPLDECLSSDEENSVIGFEFAFAEGRIESVRIDKAIESLNLVHKDLGQTIYAVLDVVATAGIGIYTYSEMIQRFSYELGFSEESSEMYEMDDDDDDQYEAERTTHQVAEHLTEFPYPWVANPQLVLSPNEVACLAAGQSECIKAAIEAVIDICTLYKEGACSFEPYMGKSQAYCLAIVEFSDHDPTRTLMDDLLEYADGCMDCYTSNLFQELVDLSDQKSFNQWWDKTIAGFRLLGAIDRLLIALETINLKANHA